MKKLLAMVLALMLLAAWMPALAEGDTQTYQNSTFGYHLDYPAGWLLLDINTIGFYLQQVTDGTVAMEGMTQTALETLKLTLDQAEPDTIAELIDLTGNTIAFTCFAFPTPADLQQANLALAPQIIALYGTMFNDMTTVDSGSVVTIGGKEYLRLSFEVTINGTLCEVTPLYYFQNDLIISITTTWITSDPDIRAKLDMAMETILNSFGLDE